MKILFPLLFTLILSAQALFGADEPASIAIKNKSSFNLDAGTRNPFWPIGWKATGKVASGSGSGGTNPGDIPAGGLCGSTIPAEAGTQFPIIKGKTLGGGPAVGLPIGTSNFKSR